MPIEVLRDKVVRPLSKGILPKQTSAELFKMPNNLRDNLDNGEWRREMSFPAVVTMLHLVCTVQTNHNTNSFIWSVNLWACPRLFYVTKNRRNLRDFTLRNPLHLAGLKQAHSCLVWLKLLAIRKFMQI